MTRQKVQSISTRWYGRHPMPRRSSHKAPLTVDRLSQKSAVGNGLFLTLLILFLEWKYFGFILNTQSIVCCYDAGCNVLDIENTVMQPRFSIRFVTGKTRPYFYFCLGKRPTGIRNLILNKNYTINGCPPAVTPALQNFTVSALLCGEPEPSDNGKTTIPPGGNSPLEEEEVENVYIFSTEKNNKVEWKIDTSATTMPVYGAHEFIRYVVIKTSQTTIDCTY